MHECDFITSLYEIVVIFIDGFSINIVNVVVEMKQKTMYCIVLYCVALFCFAPRIIASRRLASIVSYRIVVASPVMK